MQGYEGSNVVHQKKNLTPEERLETARRLRHPAGRRGRGARRLLPASR